MNPIQSALSKQLLELEIELTKTRYSIQKIIQENEVLHRQHTRIVELIRLELNADGNVIASIEWEGQERTLLIPVVQKPLPDFSKQFKSELAAKGICTDDIEEWFVQEGIIYYWLKNAVMPIAAGFTHIGWTDKEYLVGGKPVHRVCLEFETAPFLLPELEVWKQKGELLLQWAKLGGRKRQLTNEIRKIKSKLKRMSSKTVPPTVAIAATPQKDLKKTTVQELKSQTLALLGLENARQVAKWAKQQGLVVDLCYKAHWAIVLEKAQDVAAA